MKSQQEAKGAGAAPASSSDEQLTRREFCGALAVTSAGLAVVACGASAAQAAPQESPGRALVDPAPKIEGAERLLPGSSLYFTYPTGNDPAILVRTQDGQFYAYGQKCTHKGCSVYFDRARRCLECPCHQGAYDVATGRMMYGPPPRPLDQISLQMRAGDEVWAVGRRSYGDHDFWAKAER